MKHILITTAAVLLVGCGLFLYGEFFFRSLGLGRFGDEILFIYFMCAAVIFISLAAWNIKNDYSEEEVRNLGFFLGWGGAYTFICIAVPVWISQWGNGHFVFSCLFSLIFVVLTICLFIYRTCKIKCSKEPTKRLVFLKRMSLIHILAAGTLILFAVMLILSGGLETV